MPKIETIKNKWEKEEKNRIKKEEEEKRARLKRQKDAERKAQEEEEAKEKRKKLIIKHSVICLLLFIVGFIFHDELGVYNPWGSGISMTLSCYFWYYFIRWIWRSMKKREE